MSSSGLLTPTRRDALRVVLALVLLTGPLWVPALHLDDPTYHYERAEVVAADGGIEYANGTDVNPTVTPISHDIACSGGADRVCSFEYYLAEQGTLPSTWYTGNPDNESHGPHIGARYQFVLVNDTVYRPIHVDNGSARTENGLYRMDLTHERFDPVEALQWVSLHPGDDDVPSVAASAAETGHATAPRNVELPQTTIQLSDDSFYRVYQTGRVDDHAPIGPYVEGALVLLGPLVGLALVVRVLLRVEVSYVDEDRRW